MKAKKEDIGKKAEFRAATRWTGAKQVRIIKDVKLDGSISVHFGGWPDFHVNPWEILEIFGEQKEVW